MFTVTKSELMGRLNKPINPEDSDISRLGRKDVLAAFFLIKPLS